MRFRPLLLAVLLSPLGCVHVDPGPMPVPSGASPLVNAPLPAGLPSSVATATPRPSPDQPNLSGSWAYGTTDEPPPGDVESCLPDYSVTDDGVAVRLTAKDCGGEYEQAMGTFDGQRLTLTGTVLTEQGEAPVAYAMTYEPTTRHFHGTRNGTGFWLARRIGECVSPSPLCATVLRGAVYDQAGDLVPNVRITVRSLNPSNPYEKTIESTTGVWASLHTPTGVILEVTASKEGWATRSRTKTLYPVTTVSPDRLNFGGAPTPEDPDAVAYPLLSEPSPSPTEDAQSTSE